MTTKRVVITGLGAVTPLGNDVPTFWSALLEGRSGAGPITHFDHSEHKTHFACEIKDLDHTYLIPPKEAKRMDLFIIYALLAADQALRDAALDLEQVNRDEVGVIVGSGIGGLYIMEEQHKVLLEKGPGRVSPFLIPRLICNMASGQVSIFFGLRGPSNCPVTACATGTHAIGDAFKIIQRGQATAIVAGGTEGAITPLGIAGFENMKALSSRNDSPQTASRPFDKERDGFVMGEGAGVLLLEELDHAKARGARIYGEIVGYGLTSDAHHMTSPSPEGEGASRSMEMAMRDGGIDPDEVDHINAHGTSTPLNDKNETAAIRNTFGKHAYDISIHSTKSMIGHLLGAAGGVEAVAMTKALQEQVVPPTINLTTPDPECDLDYTPNKKREREIRVALSNTFGFGGHNTTIAIRRYED